MGRASDLMSHGLTTVHESAPIRECARLMVRERLRHLPAIDARGRLTGIVTDHAVFSRGTPAWSNSAQFVLFSAADAALTAADLQVPAEVQASGDESLIDVLTRMLASRRDVAVVVNENGQPSGVITEHDGVRLATQLLPPELRATRCASFDLLTVPWDAPAIEAWRALEDRGIRHILVVAGAKLYGVLSHRDLVRSDVRRRNGLIVHELIKFTDPYCLHEDGTMSQAARLMAAHKIGCIPLTERSGRVLAVVTRTDLIRAALNVLRQEDSGRTSVAVGETSRDRPGQDDPRA